METDIYERIAWGMQVKGYDGVNSHAARKRRNCGRHTRPWRPRINLVQSCTPAAFTNCMPYLVEIPTALHRPSWIPAEPKTETPAVNSQEEEDGGDEAEELGVQPCH